MKLIPFDYEKAKAGDAVVYRNGEKPWEILFSPSGRIATTGTGNLIMWHDKNGKDTSEEGESIDDLFMAPKPPMEGWVMLPKDQIEIYNTKEACIKSYTENAGRGNKEDWVLAFVLIED
jgi:hypothetical protein